MNRTLDWSLSEARSLAIKAARGAGFSWGMAEEAGFAVHWLESRSAPGIFALASYLQDGSDDAATCPIHMGAAISDGLPVPDGGKFRVKQPLLILPFLANEHSQNQWSLTWGAQEIAFNPTGIGAFDESQCITDGVHDCQLRQSDVSFEGQCRSRIPGKFAGYISELEKFAHHTYAPATEESRLAGAGAGLSDND